MLKLLSTLLILTSAVCFGQTVPFQPGVTPTDRFGRALAYVFLPDGRDVSLVLTQAGMADQQTIGLNTRYADLYAAAVQGAFSSRKGMYAELPGLFIDRNCSYFQTKAEAQAFFGGAGTSKQRDRHRLDIDGDMKACQSLPNSSVSTP